jgi:hypothetical protein
VHGRIAGKATLDDVAAGVHVVYTLSDTMRAVDAADTPRAIAWTFSYLIRGVSGSGTITGSAADLALTAVISGRQTGVPVCTFSGAFDVAR